MSSRRNYTLIATAIGVLVLATLALLVVGDFTGGQNGAVADGTVWTCSMHPQIRLDHKDICPLCGMDLTPLAKKADQPSGGPSAADAGHHLSLSEHAREMATVETVVVEPRALHKELRTVGKIEFDETTVAHITARIAGRVDEVFADFPGTIVKVGDHLVSIYSPDLYATQSEFLTNYRRVRSNGTAGVEALFNSSRRRLELWGITNEQIEELIQSGTPQTHLTIFAPQGGTIVQKSIRAGQYVAEGDSLYEIADLRHVWLILEVYETDLAWIQFGQEVEVSLESLPGETFVGQVAFIEPVLNESTRTVRVRVVLRNEEGFFRPGMFAEALIRVRLLPDGRPAPTGIEGKFACPMHPYINSDEAGRCSVCDMPLEQVPGGSRLAELGVDPKVLAVPYTAVLTTGQRQLVYVEVASGEYHLVEPRLGPRTGDYYPVIEGLEAGWRVVTRGSFLLDSQFQIAGHPSLLYPEGIQGGGVGHDHGGSTAPPESSPARSEERGGAGQEGQNAPNEHSQHEK